MEKKREDPRSTHLPSAHTWRYYPCLQQGSTPKPSNLDLSSPSWLQQSHPTTSATVLMTGTSHNEPHTHTCAALGSSWQDPSPTHNLYIWIHAFLHQGLGPATVQSPLLIFSSFFPLSLEEIPGEAPIAFLPPGIQASLHPLSVTTMVHRNCKTPVLSSHKFCHSSWLSQVAGFTRVSEKDVWASQAGNYRMTSPC